MYSARLQSRSVEQVGQTTSRDDWCRRHPKGHLSSVFMAGEQLWCTHTRRRNNGSTRVCGGSLGRAPHWCRETVVRALLGRPPIPNSDMRQVTCGSCRKMVDVFYVRHQELRATG